MLTEDPVAPAVRSVLIIEDDADQRHVLRIGVESAGHHVEVVATAGDAFELLARSDHVFDVAILDLNLPDNEGSSTLELFRRTTSIPLVVYSAADGMELERAGELGAAACLAKQQPMSRLVEAVESAASAHETAARFRREPTNGADADFSRIAKLVVDQLARSSEMGTWLVTRAVEDHWVVLAATDDHYGLEAGDVLRWSDSFCSRMVAGRPQLVADTTRDPVYHDAPIGYQIEIGSYIGLPLRFGDDELFGTLCGISPRPHPDPAHLEQSWPMYETLAQVLATALSLDLRRDQLQRRLDISENAARVDSLTGVGNRRAWDLALRNEDARSARFGHLAGVLVIDLDGLKEINDTFGHDRGDQLLRQTATVIEQSLRSTDQAFRIGGDEFAVLLPETGHPMVQMARLRLVEAFAEAGIPASIGFAVTDPRSGLLDATRLADAAMYEDKRARKSRSAS